MFIEHVPCVRRWGRGAGQAPWAGSHLLVHRPWEGASEGADRRLQESRRRRGLDRTSRLEPLLFAVWPFKKALSLTPGPFVSTIFTGHQVLPYSQPEPLTAINPLPQFPVLEGNGKLPKTMVIGKPLCPQHNLS